MAQNKTKNFLLNIALIFAAIVITIRPYISKIFGSSFAPILLLLSSCGVLFMVLVKDKIINISKDKLKYMCMCLMMFLPSLFNNAYIEDSKSIYLYYILAIVFAILLVLNKIEKKNVDVLFKYFLVFSLITGAVTWISFLFPNFYLNKIVTLLPEYSQELVVHMFRFDSAYAGLTDHYSRNAFYVILGILSCIYFVMSNDEKKSTKRLLKISLVFLTTTLFLIGKRGHLLFMIVALIAAYFIFYKIKYKTILKFLVSLMVCILIIPTSMKYIPGLDNVYNRFTNYTVDISNGRFALYKKAIDLYKRKGPIGWGQFTKSTDYYYAGVHNDYIQLYTETGLIGFTLIIGSNLIILFKVIKLSKKEKKPLIFIILFYNLFFLAYSMTGIPHYDVELYMTYFIFNAFLYNQFSTQSLIEQKKIKQKLKNI